jgi:hydroxylysine kinase
LKQPEDTLVLRVEHELTIEDLKFDPPALPLDQLRDIAQSFYGIDGSFKPLEGERDQNNRITTPDGRQYVLKISGAREDPAVVDFQVKALLHIAQRDPGIPVPRIVPGKEGQLVFQTSSGTDEHAVRLLSWLPGIPYQYGPLPTPAGLQLVGGFLARLNQALEGFSHPAAGHFMPWDSTNRLLFRRQLRELLAPDVQAVAEPALHWLDHEIYPRMAALPRQVIHQDGHCANLLRAADGSEQVAGMIDFGDMILGPVICDLAVSLADFIAEPVEPVDAAVVAAAMCRGFHAVIPLQPEQTDLLLGMVIARQILILQLFEFRRRNMENPPQFVTDDQPRMIASLKMLTSLDRDAFNRGLREVCL